MLRYESLALVAAAFLTSSSTSAQSTPSLEQLLDRMGAYLFDYETHLSSVVADERFEQNIYAGQGRMGALLESEVAFIRLPGGAEWLGFREVSQLSPLRHERANCSAIMTRGDNRNPTPQP